MASRSDASARAMGLAVTEFSSAYTLDSLNLDADLRASCANFFRGVPRFSGAECL